MIARVSVIVSGSSEPSCMTVSLTSVPGRPVKHLDGLVRAHALGRLAVDFDDLVARQNPRFVRGRADHRSDHAKPAALGIEINLNADSAELALDLPPELLPFAGVDEGGMRVQVLKHAFQGIFEQLAARDRAGRN